MVDDPDMYDESNKQIDPVEKESPSPPISGKNEELKQEVLNEAQCEGLHAKSSFLEICTHHCTKAREQEV